MENASSDILVWDRIKQFFTKKLFSFLKYLEFLSSLFLRILTSYPVIVCGIALSLTFYLLSKYKSSKDSRDRKPTESEERTLTECKKSQESVEALERKWKEFTESREREFKAQEALERKIIEYIDSCKEAWEKFIDSVKSLEREFTESRERAWEKYKESTESTERAYEEYIVESLESLYSTKRKLKKLEESLESKLAELRKSLGIEPSESKAKEDLEHQEALQTFNLKLDFTEQDLEKAYREAALKHHPDKNNGNSTQKMQELNRYRDLLRKQDSSEHSR